MFYGMKEPSEHEKAVIRRWQRLKTYKHNVRLQKEREDMRRRDEEIIERAIKNDTVDIVLRFAPHSAYVHRRLLEYKYGVPL